MHIYTLIHNGTQQTHELHLFDSCLYIITCGLRSSSKMMLHRYKAHLYRNVREKISQPPPTPKIEIDIWVYHPSGMVTSRGTRDVKYQYNPHITGILIKLWHLQYMWHTSQHFEESFRSLHSSQSKKYGWISKTIMMCLHLVFSTVDLLMNAADNFIKKGLKPSASASKEVSV